MAVELTQEALEILLDLVDSEDELRDSSGFGNYFDNPSWGAVDREISDKLVNQDPDGVGIKESILNDFGGNAFLTFFGQFFNHGLDFVAKGESGSVNIDPVSFPISAPRATIIEGTGVTPDTGDAVAAQHINKASPHVDLNQTYGSHEAVTDLLRRWDVGDSGSPVQTAYLLSGDLDEIGRALLPTLDDIRQNHIIMTGVDLTAADITNYHGIGQSILTDFIPAFTQNGDLDLGAIGNYYVAGDGRANENVMLTSIHTIWARNHNVWVDELKEKTDGWREEQYFQAARAINVAEYQRVVFTEFAKAMAGDIAGNHVGEFSGHDPTVDPSISAEFAHVASHLAASMLKETFSYVDKSTGELVESPLAEMFLSPENLADIGVASLVQGATAVEHQAIDVHVVNALRNQLIDGSLDFAALNIFLGRDTGVGKLNQSRAELFAKIGDPDLEPYENWDDFQDRNGLSDDLIDKLRETYPDADGLEAVDLWVGGLLEQPRDGQLGSTFARIFLDQLGRLQEGDRFHHLEQLGAADFVADINDQTLSDIIARNTGLTNLPENIFEATPLSTRASSDASADTTSDRPDAIVGTPDHDVTTNADGETIATHLNDDADRTDTPTNIERPQFSDPPIATPPPIPGQVKIEFETAENEALTVQEGRPLTANVALLFNSDDISEIRYQWQSSANGKTWTSIPGATNQKFTPRKSENGLSLRLALTYLLIDSAHSEVTNYSEATQAVAPAPSDRDSGNNDQPGNDLGGVGGGGTTNGGEGGDDLEDNPSANNDSESGDGGGSTLSDDVIYGSAGRNSLFGTRGEDMVFAKGGNDHVFSGRGGDVIYGGDGNDLLFGGAGDDIIFGAAGDDLIFGGWGDDTLYGGEGDDTLYGGEGDDTLYGGEGDDLLEGEEGDDKLSGGDGEDVLEGGAGEDTLFGGGGDDIIVGGTGDDLLFGGAGRDIFRYRFGDGNDAVMDFEEGFDEIEIEVEDEGEGDEATYTVSDMTYGMDYIFKNGSVLAVHKNSGKGSENSDKSSENSGSGNSGHGSDNDGSGGSDRDYDNEYVGIDPSQSDDASSGEPDDDEWASLVAYGVIEAPAAELQDAQSYESEYQYEWYDDPGLPTLLGVSTIHFSHEDTNLIG